ncbi:MAG: hypothetical protein ACYCQJ_07810 [Nitrososphaerales archaeon]
MTESKSAQRSLAYVNFRRAVNFGKIYLIMAIVVSIFISIELIAVSNLKTTSASSVSTVLPSLPALILPIFPVMGSFGGLMIFVSDKDKGVYEYLIAYGVNPSKIFWSIVLASIGLASIVLAVSIPVGVALSFFFGSLSSTYLELLLLYVIPLSYAVATVMAMAGMIWSSLSVRRTGINSPVGIISLIGLLPIVAVLPVSILVGPTHFIVLDGVISLALFVVVGVMIQISNKRIVRERFLSSA